MNILLLSFLESFYIIYIMNFFKTRYNLAHPMTFIENDYFHHPVDISEEPRRMICRFGRNISWVIALYIFFRGVIEYYYKEKMTQITKIIMLLIFLGSMINFNVTIYFIPIFAIEYLLSSSYATSNNTAKYTRTKTSTSSD